LKNCFLFLVLLFSATVHAQSLRNNVGSTYTKLTAYSNQFSDAFSFTANQGVLAAAKKFSAGVYSERRFLLKALSSYTAALVLPTASGNFGLKGDYFGEGDYNESSIGLAYARSLGTKAAVGVQFNYVGLNAAGYGSASTVNFDAGVILHLTTQLNAGFHVYNPVAASWGEGGAERLPSVYAMGLGYDVSPQVYIGAEVEKVEDQPIGVNAGLHYQIADKLITRIGVQSATSAYYFGFGVQLKTFRLDATVSLHPYLGTTPGLLLLYSSKE
jgi:hypothetical protein